MTVRWKPLLVLSGLFVVIALLGVGAIAYRLVPRGARDILPRARADRDAKRFEMAEIHYRRALQKDPRNASIHEELAEMLAEFAATAPVEKRAAIAAEETKEYAEAARLGKTLVEPRRALLALAVAAGDPAEAVRWARDLLTVDPEDLDANYVMAAEMLEDRAPPVAEAKRHLDMLVRGKAPAIRLAWVRARLAQATNDAKGLAEVLKESRGLKPAAEKDESKADAPASMALLRLRALDVETNREPSAAAALTTSMLAASDLVLGLPGLSANQITRLSTVLERVQRGVAERASEIKDDAARASYARLGDAIEAKLETIFEKALDASKQPETGLFLAYADHLRYQQKRDECLKVVEQGLKSPASGRASASEQVLGLHAVAIEAALSSNTDPRRLELAAPHIKALIDGVAPRYQGLGHLFQGAIDLEKSGLSMSAAQPTREDLARPNDAQRALRLGALEHLRIAAERLPDVAEAQARYGVALVFAQEMNLGRQYLERALRMGGLDPRYQIWAAWSMVQAGYPEEAEPIVAKLLAEVNQGRQPKSLATTLYTLRGEISQARGTPEGLKQALALYDQADADPANAQPAVQLRIAQIEVKLGQSEKALARIDALRAHGRGGPAAEQLAVLILRRDQKLGDARKRLDRARKEFPRNADLVGLDAAMLTADEKPRDADRVLEAFLKDDPGNLGVTLLRAQLLSDILNQPKEARALLQKIADKAENSAPLVQIGLLDLKRRDYEAANATIAKIRSRWKEAAAADLLEAQLALEQGNMPEASARFDAALKKDPSNKMIQYWKAQVDTRNGATAEAVRSLEQISRDRPVKEVEAGVSLMAAAQSALANLALSSGDVDGAIQRYEGLLKSGDAGAQARNDRWQLISAYAAKGREEQAQSEIASLLNDAKNPPTLDERVRAANFYRLHDQPDAARAQLDYVLKKDPANPSAAVTRAYLLIQDKHLDQAAGVLEGAIAATEKQASAKTDARLAKASTDAATTPADAGAAAANGASKQPPAVFYLMLAAVENLRRPDAGGLRAALAVLDRGLKARPEALELVRAKYRVLLLTADDKQALAFIERQAKEHPDATFLRLLADTHAERKDYAAAEQVVKRMRESAPNEPALAGYQTRLVVAQGAAAFAKNDLEGRTAAFDRAARLIRECRAKFPNDVAFLQSDCDLALRKGDAPRALAITAEMDKLAPNSPLGPLARARIHASRRQTDQMAEAYVEALNRNPRMPEARVALGQALLERGEPDEALRQAKFALEIERDRTDALVLYARALASGKRTSTSTVAAREEAIRTLRSALERMPRFMDAYHVIAEIEIAQGKRDAAVATLEAGLKAIPDDAAGLAQLIQTLAEPSAPAQPATPAALAKAAALADQYATRDTQGYLMLAAAVGFHKAGQLQVALPWAERAAAKLDAPNVHLNFGDLLLSLAEQTKDADAARKFHLRAVAQYDLVLKTQADSIDAVNNKAWILHTYLGQTQKAYEIANDLARKVDPSTLPGEFFDTLGAIQQSLGQLQAAEDSFTRGLRKAPDNAVLNYHMGKLIAQDASRRNRAGGFLQKALAARDHLSPAMAGDAAALLKSFARN